MKKILVLTMMFCCSMMLASAQNTSVSGTVMAAGGGTIKMAHVHVSNGDSYKAKPLSYVVNEKGAFSFLLPNGWHRLQFSGVDYSATPERPMEVYCSGERVIINALLLANSAPSIVDSVKIITSLTDYKFEKSVTMTKQTDGTFSAEFKSTKPTLSYQLLVFGGEMKGEHSVNGTMSDSYEYDGGGDYRSIVNCKNGVAKITFDPKKLPENHGTASTTFADEYSNSIKAILALENTDRKEFYTAYGLRKSGKPESYGARVIREKIRTAIAEEIKPVLRELQMLRYLSVGYFSDDTTGADPKYVKEILESIPPFSSIWGHNPSLMFQATQFIGDKSNNYPKQVLKDNISPYVQSEVLSSLVAQADKDKNEKVLGEYYSQLMKTFPDTYAAKMAEKRFNPNRKVKEGNQIPNFSFDGVDEETGKKITPAMLKGKWVLIDNWATWCGPCVSEMPTLHTVYEKFKNKNFVVLSVSFDRQAADITKFRGGKFKMPWMHSYSEGVWESEAAKIFEVSGIPKPILIDPKGKIIALEEELRGETLEKTLAKYVK